MQLKWTKTGRDWIGISGRFRAEVRGPNGPLRFSHWSVTAGEMRGGSGGTSSVRTSKLAAENECDRFAKFLADKITVECECGWVGKQGRLLDHRRGKYCPVCGTEFIKAPSLKLTKLTV